MKGTPEFHKTQALDGDKRLKKLKKAKRKHENIIYSIDKEILECEENIKKNMNKFILYTTEK
jgi:hypothetical protein